MWSSSAWPWCPATRPGDRPAGRGFAALLTSKLQQALAREGVVTVWGAADDGPDNSAFAAVRYLQAHPA